MKAKRLISTIDLDKKEWLKIRKETGISGSEVAAILGVSKWKSPIAVYMEKTSDIVEETPDNDFMLFGRLLEGVIADEFKRRNPEYKVKKINAILQDTTYDWIIGDIDRLIVNEKGEEGVLEIKTVSEYGKSAWEDEEVPPYYLAQLQWYLYLTDCSYGYFAALIGGNKYIQKYVERDDELIEYMIEIAKIFWKRVKEHNPPPVDGSESSVELLKQMYPESTENQVMLDYGTSELIKRRTEIKEIIKEYEEELNTIENTIKQKLGKNDTGIIDNYKVTWKSVTSSRVDSKLLKGKYPEIYKEVAKENSYRKFDVKKMKLLLNV